MLKRFAVPLVAAALLGFTGPAGSQAVLPDGPGKELVATSCAQCHAISRVTSAGYDLAGWRNDVAMMVNAGAKLTPSQIDTVVDYLVKNFPPKGAPAAVVVSGSATVTI